MDAGAGFHELVAARRQVAPRKLIEPGPDRAQIERMFSAAAAAPDHGRIRPWRFVEIPPDRRELLGEAFVEATREREQVVDEARAQAARARARNAPFLALAVVRLAGDDAEIPDAERLVSLGCGLQAILLAATAAGYGSGLASGRALRSEAIRRLFALAPDERPVCFVAIGTPIGAPEPHAPAAAGTVLGSL